MQLRYLGRHSGANPFSISVSSGGSTEAITGLFRYNSRFDRVDYRLNTGHGTPISGNQAGNKATLELELDEHIAGALEGNANFYFSAQPRSTCIWDFGDGTVMEGAFVNHEYSAPGTYTVTLTYLDDEMEVIRRMRFDVEVQ